jgi:protein-S-isoprenylcysteine O-methyltransferase Ste14
MTDPSSNTPGIRFPPPLIFLIGLGAGLALQRWLFDWPVVSEARETWIHLHAIGVGIVALWLLWSALRGFRRNQNDPRPWTRDTALVDAGIYAHTRNPMYLGMTLAYVAITLGFNTIWPLLTLGPVIFLIRHYVIAREERYLSERFGQPYLDYCIRVRRWF